MIQRGYMQYIDADEAWRQKIADDWGATAAQHMHIADGYSILALSDSIPVGLIALYWRSLPPPLVDTYEAYIDIIEVRPEFRRQGIATQLIELSLEKARTRHAYQVRAWSSTDKTAAIPMWQALGFGLCPATTYPNGQAVNGYFATRVLQTYPLDHPEGRSATSPK